MSYVVLAGGGTDDGRNPIWKLNALTVQPEASITDLFIAHGDPQHAAIWHGIAGVHGQIEDSEIELGSVCCQRACLTFERRFDGDIAAQRAGKQPFDIVEPGSRVDYLRLKHLLS